MTTDYETQSSNAQNTEETVSTDSEGLILEESELLLELVRSIVSKPEAVSVDVVKGKSTTLLTLTVDPEDRGHVIGREHRTFEAIKHLFSKAAFLENRKVVIQLDGQDLRRQPNGSTPIRYREHPRSSEREERPRARSTERYPVREYRR